ncbi:MAG: hypothetical protein WA584_13280 [Pyrinomonadaceae bacterium]
MKFFKLSLITFAAAAFLTGCGSSRTSSQADETGYVNPNPSTVVENEYIADENKDWARENLDLQAVGHLLEKSKNAEEFESLLNSSDGVNNLDLNGDGYADYISVAEYDNNDDNQRGFTLFDRFGADEIQEIARIIFDRDRLDAPGARVLLTGNEQLYGDNYYYETNWQDKTLAIVGSLFGNRDRNYQSPYYYDNYPDNYETYRVVETPVYRTRITQYYSAPVFIKTVKPAITQIKIKSPYNGRWSEKIFAKLAKPTKEQVDFRKNNPNKPEFAQVKNNKSEDFSSRNKKEKNFDDFEKSRNNNDDKFENRNKSDRSDKFERENRKEDKPNKIERENEKPNKSDKADKQNNDKQNRDGGNGKGNGGGKGNGKGKKN